MKTEIIETDSTVSSLVQSAQDKKYADFDSSTKEILSQKVATALADSGYFDRLSQARGEVQEVQESKSAEEEANFKKTLKKYGADEITDLSTEDKKKFFDEIKAFDSKVD